MKLTPKCSEKKPACSWEQCVVAKVCALPSARSSLFIYLFVCGQDISETTGRIFMKFLPEVDIIPRMTPLNFGDDLDLDLHSGSKSGSEVLSEVSQKPLDGSP